METQTQTFEQWYLVLEYLENIPVNRTTVRRKIQFPNGIIGYQDETIPFNWFKLPSSYFWLDLNLRITPEMEKLAEKFHGKLEAIYHEEGYATVFFTKISDEKENCKNVFEFCCNLSESFTV